ncbi:hypothetical protein DFH11DRAFT_853487 [Phellopilus nigrolimitatus]|nr:hypothetical protein DFH11DRAFT_853487 [Phellopilus nigrolimitatus]
MLPILRALSAASAERKTEKKVEKIDWSTLCQAFALHKFLDNVHPSNVPHPITVWEHIDYYQGEDGELLESCFQNAAFLGTTGTRASIVMLFLWIITQQFSEITPNMVQTLVSTASDNANFQPQELKPAVKLLSKLFMECPLPEAIKELLEKLPHAVSQNYAELVEAFRSKYTGKKNYILFATEKESMSDPSVLLNEQKIVIIPSDRKSEGLILWAVEKLGLGCLIGEEETFEDGKFWFAFMPQRKRQFFNNSSERVAEDPGAPKLNERAAIFASSGNPPVSRKGAVTPSTMRAANGIYAFLGSSEEKQKEYSKNTWKYIIYLLLSTHPLHSLVNLSDQDEEYLGNRVSQTFKFPPLESENLSQEDYKKAISRSKVMLYLLWVIGHRISYYKVLSLVSSIIEDSIISSLSYATSGKRGELSNNMPRTPFSSPNETFKHEGPSKYLWLARSAIEEIARSIKDPATATEIARVFKDQAVTEENAQATTDLTTVDDSTRTVKDPASIGESAGAIKDSVNVGDKERAVKGPAIIEENAPAIKDSAVVEDNGPAIKDPRTAEESAPAIKVSVADENARVTKDSGEESAPVIKIPATAEENVPNIKLSVVDENARVINDSAVVEDNALVIKVPAVVEANARSRKIPTIVENRNTRTSRDSVAGSHADSGDLLPLSQKDENLGGRIQSSSNPLIYEVDVKMSPSCLLRPHEKVLVPKTRLTEYVMEQLRKDIGEDFFTSQETRATTE